MIDFFEKKLVLLDVDNTILDWSDWQTIWYYRKDWRIRGLQAQQLKLQRGQRTPPLPTQEEHLHQTSSQPKVSDWFLTALPWFQAQNVCLAIFSDLPQSALHHFFSQHEIHTIIDASNVGSLKPFPDGIWQIQATMGVPSHNTFLIGDNQLTDGRASQAAGIQFIPVQSLQTSPINSLTKWIYG